MSCIRYCCALLLLLCGGFATQVQAASSYDNCTGFIDSIPATITTQGTWCLRSNLATAITSGNAITIATHNVTIDCNDFKLGGQSGGVATSANGIYALNRLNAVVRNCNIRGFYYGVLFFGEAGGGHVIEDSRFDLNTHIGMWVQGDGSVIRRNRVTDTGGSSVSPHAYGISTGYSVEVIDNSVSNVVATRGGNGTATGINTDVGTVMVIGNRVTAVTGDGTGSSRGIVVMGATKGVIRDNVIMNHWGNVGIMCGGSTHRASNNTVFGFQTPLTQFCVNVGGNDLVS